MNAYGLHWISCRHANHWQLMHETAQPIAQQCSHGRAAWAKQVPQLPVPAHVIMLPHSLITLHRVADMGYD